MLPFQAFRLWARRAPLAERAGAGVAALLAVALLAWVVPSGVGGNVAGAPGGETVLGGAPEDVDAAAPVPSAAGTVPGTAPGTGTGTTGTGAAVGTGAATTGTGSAGGGAAAGSGGAVSGSGRQCAAGSAPGVGTTQIKVAAMLTALAGGQGNGAFGVPSPSTQRAEYQAVFDAVNASGGAACRKLVPIFFEVNPLDQGDVQAKCLDAVEAKVFAVLDTGGAAGVGSAGAFCYGQNRLTFISGLAYLSSAAIDRFYPYLFSMGTMENIDYNAIFALRDHGFFKPTNGFKKIGVLESDCTPSLPRIVGSALRKIGLDDGQIVTYQYGCPSLGPTPSDYQQSVLKFQREGVTHVTVAGSGLYLYQFTQIAQQQGFKPKYGLPDEIITATSGKYGGTTQPDYNNIANALLVTTTAFGEESSPNAKPSEATKRCQAIYRAKGLPSVYDVSGAGVICNQVFLLKAALDHAPRLSREFLPDGLRAAKSVPFSFPLGPNSFSRAKVAAAGGFWRVDKLDPSCRCWRVIDPTFRPSFAGAPQ